MQKPQVYAHEPQSENFVGEKSLRQWIMAQKFGAQNEPQGSLLNASDRAGQAGGPKFMPMSRSRKILLGKNHSGNGSWRRNSGGREEVEEHTKVCDESDETGGPRFMPMSRSRNQKWMSRKEAFPKVVKGKSGIR